jgi:rubredoxin
MDNKQISDKLLDMAKFYQMTDEELVVIGKVIEMVESADDDLISRQAVIDFIRKHIDHSLWAFEKLVKGIKALPSVTQQQKVGRWIAQDIHNCHTDFKCSECGYIHSFMHLYGEPTADYTYCPNCGANMEGAEE